MTQAQLQSAFLQSEAEANEAVMNLLYSQAVVPPESPQLLHQSEEKTLLKPRRLRSKISVKRKASSSMTWKNKKNAANNFPSCSSINSNSNSNSSQSPSQIASGTAVKLCTETFFLNGISHTIINNLFSYLQYISGSNSTD